MCLALTQTGRQVLNLPTPEGWKAELTYRLPGNGTAGSRNRDRSLDHKSDALTTTPPSHPVDIEVFRSDIRFTIDSAAVLTD